MNLNNLPYVLYGNPFWAIMVPYILGIITGVLSVFFISVCKGYRERRNKMQTVKKAVMYYRPSLTKK